jgi:hypothetical protein
MKKEIFEVLTFFSRNQTQSFKPFHMADKDKPEPKVKRLFDPTEIRADYLKRLLTGESIGTGDSAGYTPPEFIDKSGARHGLNPNPVLIFF